MAGCAGASVVASSVPPRPALNPIQKEQQEDAAAQGGKRAKTTAVAAEQAFDVQKQEADRCLKYANEKLGKPPPQQQSQPGTASGHQQPAAGSAAATRQAANGGLSAAKAVPGDRETQEDEDRDPDL